MKKILILGAKGFIGKNLAKTFSKNSNYKIVLADSEECNLLEIEETRNYLRRINPDFVINCAYIGVNSKVVFSKEYLKNNMSIASNIIRGSNTLPNLKKIIFFGSGLEYGDSRSKINENHTLNPKNVYAQVKSRVTIKSIALAKSFNIALIVIRPFNLYGPHDNKSVIYYLIKSLKEGKKPILTGGEQIRDYLYIEDFSKFIINLLDNYEKLKNFEVYNLGSGNPVKLKNIFDYIFQIMKKAREHKGMPYRDNEYMKQVANISKIKKIIDIKVNFPLEAGLKKTVNWVINGEQSCK